MMEVAGIFNIRC